MSKVISFSISDRYLDKLRSLYPALTDNLAVKQFVTDRLDGSLDDALDDNLKTIIESSLSSTLDDVLDERLDGKLKTIIETSLDGLLEGRLDAVVGKSLTSLSDRLSRLEERLDDSLGDGLDDRVLTLIDSRLNESIARLGSCFSHRLLALEKKLDILEPLLKRERECSIASPLPPSPSLPPDEPVQPALETVTPEVSPSPPSPALEAIASIDGTLEGGNGDTPDLPPDRPAIEDSEKKIMEPVGGSDSLDTLPVPPITDKTIDQNAIETVQGDSDSSIETVTDAIELTNREKAAILGIGDSNLSKWLKNGEIPKKYDNKCRFNENKTKIILI